jgi:hypothetical protein
MDNETTPQQRAALVTWWLVNGEGLRTQDVARITGLTCRGAYRLMESLSVVIPIYLDDHRWQVSACQELQSD